MDNVTTTESMPNADRSMPIRQRDTYMLIGFCFFSLFLIGIFMAFVHRKCRDSTSKAKQWCLATCCFTSMSTSRSSSTSRVPEVLPQEIIPIEAIRITSQQRVNPAYLPDEDEGGGTSQDGSITNPPSRNDSLLKCEVDRRLRSSFRSVLPPKVVSDLEDDSGISDVSTSPRYNLGRSSRHSLACHIPSDKEERNDLSFKRDGSGSNTPKLVRVLMPESIDSGKEITRPSTQQVYNVSDNYDVEPYYVNTMFHEKKRELYGKDDGRHVYVNDNIDHNTHLYANDGVVLGPRKMDKFNEFHGQQSDRKEFNFSHDNHFYYSMNEIKNSKSRHSKTLSNLATRTLPRVHRNAHWHNYENDRDAQSHGSHNRFNSSLARNQNIPKKHNEKENDVADELLLKLARNFFRSKEESSRLSSHDDENDYVEIDENVPSNLKDCYKNENKTHHTGSLDAAEMRSHHVRGSSLGYSSCPDEELNLETVQFVKTADGRLQQITIRYV